MKDKTIYSIIRHVSQSGMTRHISFHYILSNFLSLFINLKGYVLFLVHIIFSMIYQITLKINQQSTEWIIIIN